MIKNVFDYFEDLDKKKLPRNEHGFVVDNERIIKNKCYDMWDIWIEHRRPSVTIDKTPYHAKRFRELAPMFELATDKMYNAIGVPTIPTYTLETIGTDISKYKIISQNIHSVDNLIACVAEKVITSKRITKYHLVNQSKWAIFYDKNLQELFLENMTPECLEQLQTLFLVDELRTETDRHFGNYFFVRRPKERKYSGIIALDNDLGQIFITYTKPRTKERFIEFANSPYFTHVPQSGSNPLMPYATRLKNIKKLIHDQMLTQRQITTIKSLIKYDFPDQIRIAGTHPALIKDADFAYDAVSQLWDYNREELGKELGI